MTASLPAYTQIPLPGEGPEDVVFGHDGLIYTGLSDGRILAVAPEDGLYVRSPTPAGDLWVSKRPRMGGS